MYQYWEHQEKLVNSPKSQASTVNEASENVKVWANIYMPKSNWNAGVRNIQR